jgi:hypothetical protein
VAGAPQDTVEQALQLARVRLLDAIQSISGDILTDTAAFTLPTINGAWRRFQELIVNFGIPWLKQEKVLLAVPAVSGSDPATQVSLNWNGYYNGSVGTSSPALPQDFIEPLLLWERTNGSGGDFFPMDKLDNGLPAVAKTTRNNYWEWRYGSIYMPGATLTTDIRLRYTAFYPDFVAPNITVFSSQNIPVARAMNPLAWFICSEVARARGDMDGAYFDTQAQQSTKYMFDMDVSQAKSIDNDAQYGSMSDRNTRMNGPASERAQ